MVSCLEDIEIIIMQYRCEVRRLEREIVTRQSEVDECEAMQRACQELFDQLVDLNVKLSAHHRCYQESAARLELLAGVRLESQDSTAELQQRLARAQLEKRQLERKIQRLASEADIEVGLGDGSSRPRRVDWTRAWVGRRSTWKTCAT